MFLKDRLQYAWVVINISPKQGRLFTIRPIKNTTYIEERSRNSVGKHATEFLKHKMPLIELCDISKSFDGELVLDEFNLKIKENEFITLLGPSG